MENFAPLPAAFGGLLIGLASALLWLGNGRIAGISGMFARLLPSDGTTAWRLVFLAALVLGALGAAWLVPGLGVGGPGGRPAELVATPAGFALPSQAWLVLGGLLIGFGTRIGNGCTSGHGVCGLARLSRRSLVAVAVLFGVATLTVVLTGVV